MRAIPRTTKDIDVCVANATDQDAEQLVIALQQQYRLLVEALGDVLETLLRAYASD